MSHTPGPWEAVALVHEETNEPMTPEQIGEYVCNSVKNSAEVSGTTQFLAVLCQKVDGPADVCHVGNGPTSPANALLIAAAPELLAVLKEMLDACSAAMRVIAKHDAAQEFIEEALAAGVTNWLGVRANAVIAKAEGTHV